MNTIRTEQNSKRHLEQLAAQRQVYSFAKATFVVQAILSVPVVILLTYLTSIYQQIAVYAACWGAIVMFLDLLLFTPWQKTLKELGAKIQETFDCEVLRLQWNELKCGALPHKDIVDEWAMKYQDKHPIQTGLRDWYMTNVGDSADQLSLPVARIICQRENCRWDAKLRWRYVVFVGVSVAILACGLLAVALWRKQTLEQFLLVFVVPWMPTVVLAVRQIKEQVEAARLVDRLRNHSVSLWEKASVLGDDELTQRSRILQDEIFDHRRRSPLVLDTIYWLLRRRSELQSTKTSQDLVSEALENQHVHG